MIHFSGGNMRVRRTLKINEPWWNIRVRRILKINDP
jgi:hypothetical protein